MPLRKKTTPSDGTNVPIFPIAAHFPHQNKQQGRFSGREIDIAFFEKNDPGHENKLALFIYREEKGL
jgi:hypothetical protein